MMQTFLELLRSYDPSYDDDRFEAFCTQMEQDWHTLRGSCTEAEAAALIDGLPAEGIHKDVVVELRRIERDYRRGTTAASVPSPVTEAPVYPVETVGTDPLPQPTEAVQDALPSYADDELRELLQKESALLSTLEAKQLLIEEYRKDILGLDAAIAEKRSQLDEKNKEKYELSQSVAGQRREHQQLSTRLLEPPCKALLWPVDGQSSVLEQLCESICARTCVSSAKIASLGLLPYMVLRDETFTIGDRKSLMVRPVEGEPRAEQAALEMIRWCTGLLDRMRAADGSLPKQVSFTAIDLTVPLYGLLWSVYTAITFYDRWMEHGDAMRPAALESDSILMKAVQFAALRYSAAMLTEQGQMPTERVRAEMARARGLIGMNKVICQWYGDKGDPYALFREAKSLWPVLDGSPCILRDTR